MFAIFFIILFLMCFLIGRIIFIQVRDGDRYEKIVLAQQEYSSQTIPFRRGDITDCNGTILATSTDVYNLILDCSVLSADEDALEPTAEALEANFDLDADEIIEMVEENPDSQYKVLAEDLSYEEMSAFEAVMEDEEAGENIDGVWFEKEYVREYPYSTLACALLGFTTSGNEGIGGVEDEYNEVLNGTDGRTYSYLNDDSNSETTVREAVNGQNVVLTIDANIQSIVEEKIQEFNDAFGTDGENGAEHIGVILQDPDTGEILAMACYPDYDCNNAWDLTAYYTDEEIDAMTEDETLDALDTIWNNFCISYTYEPGSTAKPFTVATGLETGTLTGDETFYCDGSEQIGGYTIHCVNTSGHGTETVQGALMDSCNDSLMQMSYLIGAEYFCEYQQIFNFGLKTNIDLPGEARTDTLIYSVDEMSTTTLATNAFGQNFNVTMIQLITAYSSLVNGGSYYQPHVVEKITDEDGNTVEEIEPTLLRQTVSEETSETMIGYLEAVVDEGTGSTAKVDGYSMCGKTGTAEKYDTDTGERADGKYVVSFIGSVPADDPEVVIYVVIDEPNVDDQAHSSYAQNVAREILEEVLPYMNIYPDEELDGTNANLDIAGEETEEDSDSDETAESEESSEETSETDESGESGETESTGGTESGGESEDTGGTEDTGVTEDTGEAAESLEIGETDEAAEAGTE